MDNNTKNIMLPSSCDIVIEEFENGKITKEDLANLFYAIYTGEDSLIDGNGTINLMYKFIKEDIERMNFNYQKVIEERAKRREAVNKSRKKRKQQKENEDKNNSNITENNSNITENNCNITPLNSIDELSTEELRKEENSTSTAYAATSSTNERIDRISSYLIKTYGEVENCHLKDLNVRTVTLIACLRLEKDEDVIEFVVDILNYFSLNKFCHTDGKPLREQSWKVICNKRLSDFVYEKSKKSAAKENVGAAENVIVEVPCNLPPDDDFDR